MNKILLTGQIATAPRVWRQPEGAVAHFFALQTRVTYHDDHSTLRQERTDSHRIVAYGSAALACTLVGPGEQVGVEGWLRVVAEEVDGETRTRIEVVAADIHFLELKLYREEPLTLRNDGNQDAGPVRLTETVPPLATFDAAASGPWTCQPDGNPGATCTLDLPGLAASASHAVDFAVRAAADLPADTRIANAACARILPAGLEACGSVETPAALSVATTLTVALQVDADHSGTVTAGDTLHYILTVPNNASAALLGLSIVPVLDPHTTLVVGSVTTDRGSVASGNHAGDGFAQVSIPSLAEGDVATITFDAEIARPLPADITRVSAQALTRGSNIPEDASDDPSTPAANDPTAIEVVSGTPQATHDVPTVGQYGLMALALLLAGGALVHLRWQGAALR